ncbi:MAG: exodeoxyribonuclease VII large subunit [Verrucomicrobia bacterium]|nr:exodeoxyribonuclease VII large subunit [Verrucomicrobiota bacterium]
MAKVSKSQWNFAGDLFPEGGRPVPESVTELTQKLRRQLEGSFAGRRVAGEVSNLRVQASGHAYFVLKDAGAQLNCVLFRGQAGGARSTLRDGAQVVLTGDITVYEPRGAYQLRVDSVEAQGVGALQAAFERLKARLSAEGLFDAARKRPLPRFPARIGLVTSPTGAAIQDVLHVLSRRFRPEVILDPVRVQGAGAGAEVAAAIARLNRFSEQGPPLDLILVTRGGGSLEDLWCFNEEIVARAIAASGLPVVSAVGHEIDVTIADFVADLRAATPSAAAEILTQDWVDSREFVDQAGQRLSFLVRRRMGRWREVASTLVRRLARRHPRRRLEERSQRLDEAVGALGRSAVRAVRSLARTLEASRQRLFAQRPQARLRSLGQAVGRLRSMLAAAPGRAVERRRRRLEAALGPLRLLSPQNVLERGYSLTFDAATGRLLHSSEGLEPGTRLRTRLASGEVPSVVGGPGASGTPSVPGSARARSSSGKARPSAGRPPATD